MDISAIRRKDHKFIMSTYGRFNLFVEKGKGCYLYDKSGKRYLDFLSGLGCAPLGHAHPEVAKAVSFQAKKLIQVSNYYYTEPQVELAEKLSLLSGLQKAFFCNSGTEANEAALKLAKKITGKTDFVVCKEAFHGRTHGSLSATWKPSFREPFLPLVEGFTFVPYNDANAIGKAISSKTAAVMLEPIQGEAGVVVPDAGYLEKVSAICKKNKVLLILDEVQSGNGRTGKYFAFQHSPVKPDIVTTAKGLANGVPIGVCMSNYSFEKGNHASTFGGNPLSCAAANATVDIILRKKLMGNALLMGGYFMKKLSALPHVKKVRGKGLMIGAEIDKDAKLVTEQCLERGLVVNNATPTVLRFLPPLIAAKKDVDAAIKVLSRVLQ